jgi:hypothetical protein
MGEPKWQIPDEGIQSNTPNSLSCQELESDVETCIDFAK